MSIFDRVKSQAEGLVQEGQAKLHEAQAQRRTDSLLRDLGRAVRDQRQGAGEPAAEERINRLLAELDEQDRGRAERRAQRKPAGDGPMVPGSREPEGETIDLSEPVGTSIPAPEPMAPPAADPSGRRTRP